MNAQAHTVDAPASHPAATLPPVGPGDHARGRADAPVTLVEYGDYQCPHCARADPVVRAVQARLGGTVRFVFRNFPLTGMHPHALAAAEAAESVATHAGPDAFWAMHGLLLKHQQDSARALEPPYLIAYAGRAGADTADIARDLDAGRYMKRVHDDFMGGARSGVHRTPTFFVNGERFTGDWADADALTAALTAAAAASRTDTRSARDHAP